MRRAVEQRARSGLDLFARCSWTERARVCAGARDDPRRARRRVHGSSAASSRLSGTDSPDGALPASSRAAASMPSQFAAISEQIQVGLENLGLRPRRFDARARRAPARVSRTNRGGCRGPAEAGSIIAANCIVMVLAPRRRCTRQVVAQRAEPRRANRYRDDRQKRRSSPSITASISAVETASSGTHSKRRTP